MEFWIAGVLFGFVAGGVLSYHIGYSNGKKDACSWLLANARACESAARRGTHTVENNMEAQLTREYIEHINGNR